MTPRERWMAVLRREKPDRVPMDYWATAEASEKLVKHIGCGNLDEALTRLRIDCPLNVGPRYVGPKPEGDADVFGLRHKKITYPTGVYYECVSHPLADYDSVEEIEKQRRNSHYDLVPCRLVRQEHEIGVKRRVFSPQSHTPATKVAGGGHNYNCCLVTQRGRGINIFSRSGRSILPERFFPAEHGGLNAARASHCDAHAAVYYSPIIGGIHDRGHT